MDRDDVSPLKRTFKPKRPFGRLLTCSRSGYASCYRHQHSPESLLAASPGMQFETLGLRD